LRDERALVRRRVGLLGHVPSLNDELTALENVRFAVRAAGLSAERAGPALDRLGLTGRLGRTPAVRMSAGQRRRTALAVLVARGPELWLLDEPHAGLDAQARDIVGSLVAEAAASGAAVVLTSHEPELAVPLADRVAVMAGGRVAELQSGRRGAAVERVLVALSRDDVDVA
ncbi:MAG: ABC transporter ATP-binding protein, partial [Acidimicrobiales bacterium]